MRVIVNKNNNALGEISPKILFRTDLDVYKNGLLKADNCAISVEGGITNLPLIEEVNYLTMGGDNIKQYEFKINDNDFKNASNQGIQKIFFVFCPGFTNIIYYENFLIKQAGTLTNTYTEEDIKNISAVQVENTIVVCCKGFKPEMIKFKETEPLFTFEKTNYWESIINGPLKTLVQEFNTVPLADTNICSWSRKDGETLEPDASITLLQGYYLKIKGSEGGVYTPEFLNKIIGGRVDFYANQFKIKGYTLANGSSGGIEGFVPQTYAGYTLIELIPIYISNSSSVPEFKNATDADGDYIYETADSVSPKREVYWEQFDINTMFYYMDIFRNNKYPSICSYYRGRLIFAKVDESADLICFSQTDNYFNFTGDVNQDTSGFTQSLPSDVRTNINYIKVFYSLMIFTNEGIWSTDINVPLSPRNSFFTKQSIPRATSNYYLSCNVKGGFYYVDFTGNKIIEINLNDMGSFYSYKEINTLNIDIMQGETYSIDELVYGGDYFLAVVKKDYIALCKINNEQKVAAWSRMIRSSNKTLDFFLIEDKVYFLEYDLNNYYYYNRKFSDNNFSNIDIVIYPVGINMQGKMRDLLSLENFDLVSATLNLKGKGSIQIGREQPYSFDCQDRIKTINFNNILCDKDTLIPIKYIGSEPLYLATVNYIIEYDENIDRG